MTISRRSFARSILTAVAGATVLRQSVAAPVKEQIAEAFGVPAESVPDGPRTIAEKSAAFDHEAFNAFRDASGRPRQLTVTLSVSREILHDSLFDICRHVEDRLASALARAVDEQWGEGVSYFTHNLNWHHDPLIVTYAKVATEITADKLQELRDQWSSLRVGPRDVVPLPLPDPLAVAERKKWRSVARHRFGFTLDPNSPPR